MVKKWSEIEAHSQRRKVVLLAVEPHLTLSVSAQAHFRAVKGLTLT